MMAFQLCAFEQTCIPYRAPISDLEDHLEYKIDAET